MYQTFISKSQISWINIKFLAQTPLFQYTRRVCFWHVLHSNKTIVCHYSSMLKLQRRLSEGHHDHQFVSLFLSNPHYQYRKSSNSVISDTFQQYTHGPLSYRICPADRAVDEGPCLLSTWSGTDKHSCRERKRMYFVSLLFPTLLRTTLPG